LIEKGELTEDMLEEIYGTMRHDHIDRLGSEAEEYDPLLNSEYNKQIHNLRRQLPCK